MNLWLFIGGILLAILGGWIRFNIDRDLLNYWTGLRIANGAMLAGLALVVAGAVTACSEPSHQTAKPDADVTVSLSSGGPPEQEVALDYYKTLTGWAKAYPQLRPPIIHALANDGKVTYAEFDEISQRQQVFADAEGRKAWDAEAKPYRQALKKAATS